jgi:hypothetical protein
MVRTSDVIASMLAGTNRPARTVRQSANSIITTCLENLIMV